MRLWRGLLIVVVGFVAVYTILSLSMNVCLEIR